MTSMPARAFRVVMKPALLAALFVFMVGCGGYSFPGERPSPSPATGTVSGHVVAIPCKPVMQAGDTCAGRPVAGLELDYLDVNGAVKRAVTDGSGNYSIRLEPGAYAVKMKTYLRVISGPLKLAVQAGS
ncbi:MAG TPA: hypothetical protein VJP81_02035, partial [Candidatus Dormibacteraeota bacterium]|nr:hypothetical protein [Candidatus Dormibacteraeota bacterium]